MTKIDELVNRYWKSVKWFWTLIGHIAVEHTKYWADKFREEIKNE